MSSPALGEYKQVTLLKRVQALEANWMTLKSLQSQDPIRSHQGGVRGDKSWLTSLLQ